LRRDTLTAEEATVEAFDGILAALDAVKLDVDLSIGGSGSDADVDDLPIATATLFLDVFLELFVPARSQGTRIEVSSSVMLNKVDRKALTLSQCTSSSARRNGSVRPRRSVPSSVEPWARL
jgi:hypothetical protein